MLNNFITKSIDTVHLGKSVWKDNKGYKISISLLIAASVLLLLVDSFYLSSKNAELTKKVQELDGVQGKIENYHREIDKNNLKIANIEKNSKIEFFSIDSINPWANTIKSIGKANNLKIFYKISKIQKSKGVNNLYPVNISFSISPLSRKISLESAKTFMNQIFKSNKLFGVSSISADADMYGFRTININAKLWVSNEGL